MTTLKDKAAAINSSPVGIFYTDQNGDWSYVNDTWCKITGLSSNQANNSDWLANLHPDDKTLCEQQWQQTIQAWQPYRSQHRYIQKDGSSRLVQVEAFPTGLKGAANSGYIGILKIIEQMTDDSIDHLTKNAPWELIKAQWQAMVENTEDYVLIVNRNAQILHINRTEDGLSQEDVLNTKMHQYVDPKFHPSIDDALNKAFKLSQSTGYTVSYSFENGDNHWLFNRVTPINYNGQNQFAIVIASDVTEIFNAEHQRLTEINKNNEQQRLDSITTGLMDKLRQPLTSITNYASGLLRRLDENSIENSELHSVHKKIAEQAYRAGAMITAMRDLVPKASVNYESTCINQLVLDSVRLTDRNDNKVKVL